MEVNFKRHNYHTVNWPLWINDPGAGVAMQKVALKVIAEGYPRVMAWFDPLRV